MRAARLFPVDERWEPPSEGDKAQAREWLSAMRDLLDAIAARNVSEPPETRETP